MVATIPELKIVKKLRRVGSSLFGQLAELPPLYIAFCPTIFDI
jgi:hypothetical protein